MKQKETTLPKYNKSFFTNAIEASIIALVVLVPMVFYPRCITVFIPAKELCVEIFVLLTLMFWGLEIASRGEIKFTSVPFNFPVLSFIAICLFSLIWSNNIFVSLKELPLFLAGPLLYFVITNNISDVRPIRRILNVLLIVGSLFGIYGILQYNGIDFSFWVANVGRRQVFGLFGNVNYFAEYLIVPLPIAVSLFFAPQNKFKKILLLIGIIAMGASLTATVTRGSYLGFGVSLIFMFFLFLIFRGKDFIKRNKIIFIAILVIIIIITTLFIIPNPLNKSGTAIEKIKSRISISRLTQSYPLKRRIATWKFTVLMIKDHPLLGSGIGTFKYNTLKYQAEFFKQGENRALYPHGFAEKAHNEYLQLWAEMGIVGLGIFVWLIISYFNYGLKILRKIKDEYKQAIIIGLMGSVVAVLIDSLLGFPLHLPATIILFWMALGLTVAFGESEKDGKKPEKILDNFNQENKKNKEKQDKNTRENNKKSNISRFTPLLYILIISLTIFLGVTLSRPFIARIYWYYANREIKNENWDEAIKISEKGLKWDPYLGRLYFGVGLILQDKGIYNLALGYFEKTDKYTDIPSLPHNFAFIYLKKGELDKAVIKLKQAISYQDDEKSMFPLYSELGNVYLQLEKYKLAEALKINPEFVNAHYGMAGAYLNQNKAEKAIVILQKIIELAPDSKEAQNARDILQQIAQEKLKAPPTETDNPKMLPFPWEF